MAEPTLSEEQKDTVRKIVQWSKSLGVDPDVALAIANAESELKHVPASDPKSTSFGPFQVNRATAAANNVNYDDMVKNRDLATWTGIANLARHAQNPTLGEDPSRVIAAHRWGENSPYALSGNPKDLPPGGANYLASVGEMLSGGDFPDKVFSAPEVSSHEARHTVQPKDETTERNPMLSPLAESAITGVLGAGLGVSSAAALANKVADPYAKLALARQLFGSNSSGVPVENAPVEVGSSTWPGVKTPATSTATGVQRQVLGNTDATGNTGRENQEGYNIRSAQEKARREVLGNTQKSLNIDPNAPLANAPDLASTHGGILAPKTTLAAQESANAAENDKLLHRQAQARNSTLSKANTAGSIWQNEILPAIEAARNGTPAQQSAARTMLSNFSKFFVNPAMKFGAVTGGMGAAIPTALGENSLYEGAKDIVTGAGIGALLSKVPTTVAAPLSAVAQGIDAQHRAATGDTVGSGVSTAGALGSGALGLGSGLSMLAKAPKNIPGMTAAGVAALGAPVVNTIRDYVNKHPDQFNSQGALRNVDPMGNPY